MMTAFGRLIWPLLSVATSLTERMYPQRTMWRPATILCLTAVLLSCGCVRRTIRITTEPPGALVWLNHHEIGRTPVDADFTHYGTYDLMIKKAGYEPLIGAMPTGMSVHGTPGVDLVLEVLPIKTHDVVEWHVDLVPRDNDQQALLRRAAALRAEVEGLGPSHTTSDEPQPESSTIDD